MRTISITMSESEYAALSAWLAEDPKEWVGNIVKAEVVTGMRWAERGTKLAVKAEMEGKQS